MSPASPALQADSFPLSHWGSFSAHISLILYLARLEKTARKKIIQCYKATCVECQAIFINATDLKSEAD